MGLGLFIAKTLLEKEVIFREDLELVFGKRPFDKESEKILPVGVLAKTKPKAKRIARKVKPKKESTDNKDDSIKPPPTSSGDEQPTDSPTKS